MYNITRTMLCTSIIRVYYRNHKAIKTKKKIIIPKCIIIDLT